MLVLFSAVMHQGEQVRLQDKALFIYFICEKLHTIHCESTLELLLWICKSIWGLQCNVKYVKNELN